MLGCSSRTIQRWMKDPDGSDKRKGPNTPPPNKLSEEEESQILYLANKYNSLSPAQIVPTIIDEEGIFVASERTFYRILHKHGMQKHRSRSKAPVRKTPPTLTATGPNQVYTWDITFLKGPIKGSFFYLYFFIDLWSRKIVGYRVEDRESMELSAELIVDIVDKEGIKPGQVKIHSDNGGPMKGATMLSTLQALGIVPSFSRPSVSNDNPFSEALFRTLKYRPNYPFHAFQSLKNAREWVDEFVDWYNNEHKHSAIKFVTPASRHSGESEYILKNRALIYEAAKKTHPERWSKNTRDWTPVAEVTLNGRGLPEFIAA